MVDYLPQQHAKAMDGKQLGFSDDEQCTATKCNKKEMCLAEMDQAFPCQLFERPDFSCVLARRR